MELVSTMEINGEEREIADAYARGQIDAINSNLDGLGYGDNGVYNLLKPTLLTETTKNGVTCTPNKDANGNLDGTYTLNGTNIGTWTPITFATIQNISGTFKFVVRKDSSNVLAFIWNATDSKMHENFVTSKEVTFDADKEYLIQFVVNVDGAVIDNDLFKPMLTEDLTATYDDFKPYIPSVKMLADENAQQNTESMDLKMLGWTVPKECPIQNYTDSDGVFHQRVGRVDLGSLNWTDNGDHKIWYTQPISNSKVDSTNGYCKGFEIVGYIALGVQSIVIHHPSGNSYIKFTNEISDIKQALQGVYLYYELAEEKTISVDGNEVVDRLKNDLSEKLKVISVSLSDVMVSAMSSTTVNLPQEYIDAGYVIANILSKPDTGLNYTTGSETSIIIRNNTDSAVAFAPTTTVKVLIAKIG